MVMHESLLWKRGRGSFNHFFFVYNRFPFLGDRWDRWSAMVDCEIQGEKIKAK